MRRPPAHLQELVDEIESGQLLPTAATLRRVCDALDLTVVERFDLQRVLEETWSLYRATRWTTFRRVA